MSTQPAPSLSPSQYLEIERAAEYKSEYYAGEMFAMTGASRSHNLIVGNLIANLHHLLRDGPCEVYPSDMRVKVDKTGLYTYPDVVVACDKPEFEDANVDTLLNPTLLIEVLSDSTEKYDQGKKSRHYRRLESLQEYLLISQSEPRVEHYARQKDGHWIVTDAAGPEASVQLAATESDLLLSEVYARVEFSAKEL